MEIRSISQASGKELLERIKKDHININTVDTGRMFKLCRESVINLAKQVHYQPNNSFVKDLYCYSFMTEQGVSYYLIFDIVIYNYNGTPLGGLGTIHYAGTNIVMANKAYELVMSMNKNSK